MENTLTEQIKPDLSVHVSFDQFQAIDMPFNHSIVPFYGEGCYDGVPVLAKARDKTMQFRARALKSLLRPFIKLVGTTMVKHLPKALHELVEQSQISTVRDADRILVIDDGKQVEHGSHNELVKLNKYYARLIQSQLSSGEIKND